MKHLGGKTAALTGAASGIGRALAFLRWILRDQRRILVGQDAKIMDLAVRVSPVGFVDWAGRVADRVTRAWAERQNNKK